MTFSGNPPVSCVETSDSDRAPGYHTATIESQLRKQISIGELPGVGTLDTRTCVSGAPTCARIGWNRESMGGPFLHPHCGENASSGPSETGRAYGRIVVDQRSAPRLHSTSLDHKDFITDRM
jgi:hypothetical protein